MSSQHTHVDHTRVKFRTLTAAEIARYVEREQPLDCAGGFKSEGLGISLCESIDSADPSALIGLPLIALTRLLRGVRRRTALSSASGGYTATYNPASLSASATMDLMSANTTLRDDSLHQRLDAAMAQVNQVLLGKPRQIKLAFTCLIAGGHLLLEDIPGVGKTTLAHALAASFALDFQRVQFTSDLLPSDIVGVSIYERETSQFRFHPGPIFTGLLLADEINRASPKTQSALLEAMAENQVTVDGQTHILSQPFFVVATQNPLDLDGTFPLPDSQLDRFMLRLSLDYPDAAAERALLVGDDRRDLLARMMPQLDAATR